MTSHHTPLLETVRAAMASLQQLSAAGGRVMLTVPVQYPSGSMAVIEIEANGSNCWLSDMGMGLYEAEYVSAEKSFLRAAKNAAKHFGVGFDGHAIFALEVPLDRVAGGVVAVANASARAAIEAVQLEAAKRVESKCAEVFERLVKIFPDARVERDAEIRGDHATWDAHNVVRLPNRTALFEPMGHHAQSVSAKFQMMSDLKRLPNLSLNVVVENPDGLDDRGRMIDAVATIIRADAPDNTFRKLAAA